MRLPCRFLFFAVLAMAPVAWAQGDVQERLDEIERTYRQQGPEAALPLFLEMAAELESTGDTRSLGHAVGFIGEIHWRLGNYEEADAYLQRALILERDSGNRLQEGKTLNVLGLLYWDLGEFEQAKAYFRQGADIATEVGDQRLTGAILNNLSLVLDEEGDYYTSLEQYQKALEIYAGENFPRGEGDTLGNIGGVYLLLGRYREALERYQEALAISEELDSAISMSQDHGNIALAYLGLGQVDPALEHLDRAIALASRAGMRQDEAYWLGAKGNAHLLRGRYDQALELHTAGLEIYAQLDGQTELVVALHEMGQLHLLLGDSNSAADFFRRSLELARSVGVSRYVTANQVALGDLHFRQEDREAAMALYVQAAERARESGELGNWVEALLRQSAAYRESERFGPALELAGDALKISRETGALGLEVSAQYTLAEAHRLGGDLGSALDTYAQALDGLNNAPNPELAWRSHYGQGLALAETGRTGEAIESLQAAIAVIEGVRDRLQQERFRAGYIQDKYQVYVDLVRLQLEAGREEEAFSTAERLRSRSYLDMLDSTLPQDPDQQNLLTEFALKERIRTLRRALNEEQGLIQPEQRQLAISVYTQELLAAEQAYQAWLDDRRSGGGARREPAPSYVDVRRVLQTGEALIEYVVGTESVMLFLLTRQALITHTVPLRRDDLDNKVGLVRNLIRRQDSDRWRKPAASLSRSLLEPMLSAGQLDGVKHLYLVPHGTLNYLPFALLPVGGERRVIEDYNLAYLPTAAALLRQNDASANASDMLAMAPARSRLQHASAEARAVNALFDPNSTALLGAAATESAFKQQAEHHRLLHLATHGYFNKFNPMLSGLELEPDQANDGQLELYEILGLRLDADLVTLSACQTALGSGHFNEVPAGDDFVGLTRAFLYAGSASVMATLWEVDDASTLNLMQDFYRGLSDPGPDNRAEALARAQRAFLASENYQHPYYWAPFVLVGEMSGASGAKS